MSFASKQLGTEAQTLRSCVFAVWEMQKTILSNTVTMKEGKPTVQFRQMVSKVQNAHRNTVRYLELARKSGKYNVRVDPSLLRLMTSEFGGASDFITSIGPEDSVIMLYSCPSCNTAPLRIKDWLY
eukprot:4878410-Amphidinium_carterae.1